MQQRGIMAFGSRPRAHRSELFASRDQCQKSQLVYHGPEFHTLAVIIPVISRFIPRLRAGKDVPCGSVDGTSKPKSARVDQNGNCTGFRGRFRLCAQWIAAAVGSPWAFLLAALSIALWAVLGPLFHYSDSWQLVINTATTIITFLMVFLIQNTQNRDTKAVHLKLDELLRGVTGARTSLVNLESLSDEDLDRLQKEFERLKQRASRVEKANAR